MTIGRDRAVSLAVGGSKLVASAFACIKFLTYKNIRRELYACRALDRIPQRRSRYALVVLLRR